MSRCYICDSFIETPRIDPKTGKMRHCSDCDDHIQDALGDFETDDDQLEFDFLDEED